MKYLAYVYILLFAATLQSQESVLANISGDQFLGVPGKVARLSLKSEECKVSSEKTDESEYKLVFSCQSRSQVIWDMNVPVPGDFAFDDPKFSLLWAGDKDGDGKIDLVMEMSPKYSCTKEVTFLSSLAEYMDLVGIQGSPETTCPD